jgi:hypothetical protein
LIAASVCTTFVYTRWPLVHSVHPSSGTVIQLRTVIVSVLIGTIVNNPILIVHQALNYIRNEAMERRRAIALSTQTRVRPIFMSVITSVAGMAPLAAIASIAAEQDVDVDEAELNGRIAMLAAQRGHRGVVAADPDAGDHAGAVARADLLQRVDRRAGRLRPAPLVELELLSARTAPAA